MLKTWNYGDYVEYKATGKLTNGKPFRAMHSTNWLYIQGINLYCGHKWGLKPDGHWQLLQTVTN